MESEREKVKGSTRSTKKRKLKSTEKQELTKIYPDRKYWKNKYISNHSNKIQREWEINKWVNEIVRIGKKEMGKWKRGWIKETEWERKMWENERKYENKGREGERERERGNER